MSNLDKRIINLFVFSLIASVFICLSPSMAAYTPSTFSNGSVSYSNIDNVVLNGGVAISNPSTGQVIFEVGAGNLAGGPFADNTLIRGDGGGSDLQDSLILLDNGGNISQIRDLTMNGDLTVTGGISSFTNGDFSSNLSINGDLNIDNVVKSNVEFNNGNCGAASTVDWNNGNKQRITLNSATCTVTFTAPAGPAGTASLLLKVIQDGTGNREITWPGTVGFPNGAGINLTDTAAATDFVSCYYDGTEYFCLALFNY